MTELEKIKTPKDVSPKTRYVIKKLGIDLKHILPRTLGDFKGDKEEQQIQLDFYEDTRQELIKQIGDARAIAKDFDEEQKKEDERKKSILFAQENAKFQKICQRQNKELQQLCNDQMLLMSARNEMDMKERLEQERKAEVDRLRAEKLAETTRRQKE